MIEVKHTIKEYNYKKECNKVENESFTIKIHQSTRTATIPVIAKDPETAIEGARLYLARHIDKLHFKAETNYIIEEAPMSGGK